MDPKDKQIAELTATATRLEGELSKSHKWGQLNDAERAYAKSLGNDTERELFVAKTATERDIIVKAYTEVVYEDLDGNKYTKADDKRLVDNAKRSDAAMKRAHEAEAKERAVTMTKRAEAELSNLPGTAEDKAWLLDVVSKAAEADLAAAKLAKADDAAIKSLGERAKRVGEILKAGNTAMSGVYVPSSTDVVEQTIVTKNADGSETTETVSVAVPTHGDASVGIAKNADGQAFERLVRAHMAKTKCDEADAYAAVMKSHPDLYKRAYGSYGPQA